VSRVFLLIDRAPILIIGRVQTTVTLEINGRWQSLEAPANVRELLEVLGVEPNRIAVELNHRLVKRQAWETTPVADRDHIEIVEFVGGG